MFNFSLPNLNNISNLGQEQDTKKVKSYLYQLTEQLRYVLNNIDVENFSSDIAKQYENTVKVSEALAKIEETVKNDNGSLKDIESAIADNRETLLDNYETLTNAIATSATEITQAYTVDIQGAMSEVSESYALKSETAEMRVEYTSGFEQTAKEMLAIFDQEYEGESESTGEFAAKFRSYIRFSGNGIEIGEEGDALTLLLSNESIVLQKNGENIRAWTEETLYPGNIMMDESHRLQHGNFAWIARGKGNYSLLKVK